MQVTLDKKTMTVKQVQDTAAPCVDVLDQLAKALARAFVEERQAKGGESRCKKI
ncbi:MAG: hypothetical protein E6276_06155 [Clostridiales bacterium]|nr:hypothetical protein [Clostridiales bacterium]